MKKSPGGRGKTGEDVARLIEAGEQTRWKPGVSGNPSGRPASQTLSKACRFILSEIVPGMNGVTYAEAIARRLADKALEGDVRAAAELAERAEGRPSQPIDLEVTQIARQFESMTREQLLRYAETGKLPEGVNDERLEFR